MSRGLLLGNGINNRIGITELSVTAIYERFIKNLARQSVIFEKVFHVRTRCDVKKIITDDSENKKGIECLARFLYDYVKNNTDLVWSKNCEYRLQDLISCLCITSIFYDEDGLINNKYNSAMLPVLAEYDYIFTLNYFEFWDNEHCAEHLHGWIDIRKFPDAKNVVIVSNDRLPLRQYKEAIKLLEKDAYIVEIDTINIVFAPEKIDKNELVCIAGLHPSKGLYPAEDLCPVGGKELYAELHKVDSIDVLGMSPYGDQALIDVLNRISKTRVFVYDMQNNVEVQDWKYKLYNDYELLDSSMI